MREAMNIWGQADYGQYLYLPPNFAMTLKLSK